MTQDEIIEKVKQKMFVALEPFKYKKNTKQTRDDVRSAITEVLQEFYDDGTIDIIPVVDIDHEMELNYIRENMGTFMEVYNKTKNLEVQEAIRDLVERLVELKDSISTSGTLKVSLKFPETFEPFEFEATSNVTN